MTDQNKFYFTSAGQVSSKPDYSESNRWQMFLNNSSIMIRTMQPRNNRHGQSYMRDINTTIYKALTNKHGQKYLAYYTVTEKGAFFRQGHRAIGEDTFLSPSFRVPEEMGEIFSTHLSKILGIPFDYKENQRTTSFFGSLKFMETFLAKHPDYWDSESTPEILTSPFMRSKENREWLIPALLSCKKILLTTTERYDDFEDGVTSVRWHGPRGLNTAVRNARDVKEFVSSMVYKAYLKTDEDIQSIIDNPLSLGVFSNLNLHMGAKQAIDEGYVEFFREDMKKIPYAFGYLTQFLLSNLSASEAPRVLSFIKRIAQSESKSAPPKKGKMLFGQDNKFGHVLAQNNLIRYAKQVPMGNRRTVASRLLDLMEEQWEKVEKEASTDFKIGEIFDRAYIEVCVMGNATDSAAERCVAVAKELFDIDLREGKSVILKTDANGHSCVPYFSMPRMLFQTHANSRLSPEYTGSELLFRHLVMRDMGFGFLGKKIGSSVLTSSLAYLGEDRLRNEFILCTDVEAAMKKTAEKIDSVLEKLGKPITACNRMLYLAAPAHRRNYKVDWKFFEAGIIDSYEINLYRKAKITSKKAIAEWSETARTVPSEMYMEFLRDAAGEPSRSNNAA